MIPAEREDPAMSDPKTSPHQHALARQRAQLIMQVRSGVLTA